jgi:hypothetical protein
MMVRLPEGTENIRSAPVRVLRAIFSGIGQLLVAADRLREEDAVRERLESDDHHDPLAAWEGRLSSSVRIIPPAHFDVPAPEPGPSGAGTAPAAGAAETGQSAGRPAAGRAAARPPAGRKAAGRTAAGKAAAGRTAAGKAAAGQTAAGRTAAGQAAAGQAAAGRTAAGQAAAGQAAAGRAAKKPQKAAVARAAWANRAAGEDRADRAGQSAKPGSAAKPAKPAKPAASAGGGKPGTARSVSSRKPGRSKSAGEQPRFRSLDLTGNVRMLSDQDIADLAEDARERGQAGPVHSELARSTPGHPALAGSWAGESATPPWSDAAPSWSSWSTSASPPDAGAAAVAGQGAVPEPGPTVGPEHASAAPGPEPAVVPEHASAAPGPEPAVVPEHASAIPGPEPAVVPEHASAAPEPAPATRAAARLPIEGYDELTLPSLRARLRQLTVDQLDVLLAYERSNASRDDVVTMFERRIAKLNDRDD